MAVTRKKSRTPPATATAMMMMVVFDRAAEVVPAQEQKTLTIATPPATTSHSLRLDNLEVTNCLRLSYQSLLQSALYDAISEDVSVTLVK
jgi:hypothetical protein